MIADDLFAGAGGWDVAADWLDIHARGVENMPQARATRDAAGLTTIHDDVWTFKPRYVGTDLQASGLIASPPCQTFSQAGSGSGRKALDAVLEVLGDVPTMTLPELRAAGERFGDDRTALVLTPLWFAIHHPYRWLAWEQVPTVLPVWEACADVLRDRGWHVWTGHLHAEQYGVPQTRKRAFLLASRDHRVTAPTPTHSRYHVRTPSRLDPGVLPWVSMAEGLGWEGRVPATLPDGSPRWHDQSGTPVDQEWPFKRPATVAAGRDLIQNPGATANRYNGSTKSRNDGVRVTVAEAGALQSFPRDYPWASSKQFLQAGNAVPALLAMAALSAATGQPYVPPTAPVPTAAEQPALI